jgi:hypothetical protein
LNSVLVAAGDVKQRKSIVRKQIDKDRVWWDGLQRVWF